MAWLQKQFWLKPFWLFASVVTTHRRLVARMFTSATETLPSCEWWRFGPGTCLVDLAGAVTCIGILKLLVLYRQYKPQSSPNLMTTMSLNISDDPECKEDVAVVLSCYNETREELQHSISTLDSVESGSSARLMIFVDGLQHVDQDEILDWFHRARQEADVENQEKHKHNEVQTMEDLEILASLTSILPVGKAELAHGCVCVRGMKEAPVPYPFEIYVKGKDCPRSKRASQALCMSILQASHNAGRANPKALLLLDGDCRVEPTHVGKMYRCLQDQHLAACGPFLLTKKTHNFCLLVQLMRDWFSQRMLWLGQSAVRFQLPLNGSCAMYAMETVRAVQADFCRGVYEHSILDSMMIEMGEDSFMTNLVHEKYQTGGGIRFLPHCWATSFMPETWNEYLAQQCRWKRSHMGNRLTMLFHKPNAWLCQPTRWVFWPIYVASFLWTPFLAPATLTLWFSFLTGRFLERFFQLEMDCYPFSWSFLVSAGHQSIPACIHFLLWLVLILYAFASAGCSVRQRRWLHTAGTRVFMLLGALQMAVLLVGYGAWKNPFFWASTLGVCVLMMAAQAPHGTRRMWAGLLIFVVPLTTFIENLQQPIVAVANADGLGAKWGTRGKAAKSQRGRCCCIVQKAEPETGEECQRQCAREIRLWSRRALLPLWLVVNYGLGEWVFQMDCVDAVAIAVSLMMAGFMLFHLCLGLGYSCWLAIFLRRHTVQGTAVMP